MPPQFCMRRSPAFVHLPTGVDSIHRTTAAASDGLKKFGTYVRPCEDDEPLRHAARRSHVDAIIYIFACTAVHAAQMRAIICDECLDFVVASYAGTISPQITVAFKHI